MESKLFAAICYNFTEELLTEIALARGITATLCCVISTMVLVILFIRAKIDYHKVCGTVVKRLAIGLTVVSVLQQFNLALGLINHFTAGLEEFCQVNGFLNQYFDSVQRYFTLGISLVLFLKVAKGTCSWKCFTGCCKNTTGHTFTCCRRERRERRGRRRGRRLAFLKGDGVHRLPCIYRNSGNFRVKNISCENISC